MKINIVKNSKNQLSNFHSKKNKLILKTDCFKDSLVLIFITTCQFQKLFLFFENFNSFFSVTKWFLIFILTLLKNYQIENRDLLSRENSYVLILWGSDMIRFFFSDETKNHIEFRIFSRRYYIISMNQWWFFVILANDMIILYTKKMQ